MINAKGFKFWIIYLAVVIVFAFGCLELVVRVLGLAPGVPEEYSAFIEGEYLPYKPKPNSIVRGRSLSDEFDYKYVHNSVGFRDVEHTQEKSAGVFRIFAVGDSFTYGAGVQFEETYLCQLEKMLNRQQEKKQEKQKVEIIKAGISGYWQEQEYLMLKHFGARYRPDFILVGFLPNDVIGAYNAKAGINVRHGYLMSRETAKLGKAGVYLYIHSHLLRICLRKYIDIFHRSTSRDKKIPAQHIYKPYGAFEQAWENIEDYLEKMADVAIKINAKFAVVHIPQAGPYPEFKSYPAKRLAEWCKTKHVYFIDTLPAIKEASKYDTLYWKKNGHCNAKGYKIIADVIYDSLVRHYIIE